MTREEAIHRLTDLQDGSGQTYEAIRMAIEALQAEYEDYEHATLVDIKEPLKVAVVRCKDCQYLDAEEDNWCYHFGYNVYDTDYCSYGERREE